MFQNASANYTQPSSFRFLYFIRTYGMKWWASASKFLYHNAADNNKPNNKIFKTLCRGVHVLLLPLSCVQGSRHSLTGMVGIIKGAITRSGQEEKDQFALVLVTCLLPLPHYEVAEVPASEGWVRTSKSPSFTSQASDELLLRI